jgi:hypothetical protein
MKIIGGLPIALFATLTTVLVWITALCLCVSLTCTPGWNDPTPITPEPGLPCGRVYHACPKTGGCCASDETCGEENHACGLHDCCFVGDGVMARRRHLQWRPTELPEGGRP